MSEPVREAAVARPAGPLRAVVREHHGYLLRGVPCSVHLGLPSPYLTVIFTLHEPLRMIDSERSYRALVGGLHTRAAAVEHGGAQSGIQLQLSPLGARALFGLPAGELAGLDVAAADLLGPLGVDLQEQLAAADTWADRFALLDARLGGVLDADRAPAPEVRHAWHLLLASGGTARVADVAAAVGWSERHLAARFRTEVGLPPKVAGRVIRFDRARRLVPHRSGADVAASCGYADQSHLVGDFVAFTGLSPRAWLAAEVGNLQAAAGAAPAH